MKLASHRKRTPLERLLHNVSMLALVAEMAFVLLLVTASAQLQPLPTAQERFAGWVEAHNDMTVHALPGDTPEPSEQLAIIPNTGVEVGPTDPASAIAASSTAAPTEAPAQDRYPNYPPGSLVHETDTLTISIEQYAEEDLVYFVADIVVKDPAQLASAFSYDTFKGARESASDIARRNEAVLAVNGDFCGFHNEGIIIRNGETYRKQNSKRHLLIVDQNGDMSVLTDRREKQGVVANQLAKENVLHTFEFGPVLVKDGEACDLPKNFFISTREDQQEPRTAIGQVGPLHYIVIVADGRTPGYSEGASLPKLQELFLQHGATIAFNLDGGGSTAMYFNGQVINHPSSGDERRVSDIVMFRE